jgi:hypothetical protein
MMQPQSAFNAFIGKPVPVVRADDVRRVWSFLASEQGPGRSVSLKLLAGMCDLNADVLAVWFRATFVEILLHQGLLERWREGNSLRGKVFEVAAGIPFPHGPGNADPDAFVSALD